MKKLISMAAITEVIDQCGGPDGLRETCRTLGCDGYELIWGGEPIPADLPADLTYGYHLTFYPDWLDFWRGDQDMLVRKYGNRKIWEEFYGGKEGPDTLMEIYRADLERAAALKVPYVVFHVSDISIEEGYTYRWFHTNEEVIDASVSILNDLLSGRDWPFKLLVENQWWPGFTFTDPRETARLIEGIRYGNKGIMLDTGHLMNCNTALRTQKGAAKYIHKMLDRHGELSKLVRGMHLHYSLSGRYVRSHTGFLPDGLPPVEESGSRFGYSYSHILKVDRHQPWTDPAVRDVVARIDPDYLVHELSADTWEKRRKVVGIQQNTLWGT